MATEVDVNLDKYSVSVNADHDKILQKNFEHPDSNQGAQSRGQPLACSILSGAACRRAARKATLARISRVDEDLEAGSLRRLENRSDPSRAWALYVRQIQTDAMFAAAGLIFLLER